MNEMALHLRYQIDHDGGLDECDARVLNHRLRRTLHNRRFPGETSALCLVWAVLELSSRGWRGVVITPRAVAEIERLRRALAAGRQLDDEAREEVVAA